MNTTIEVKLSPEAEAKRQCLLQIADSLKQWSTLNPDARDKFRIASITQAIGWSADLYVDLGFDHKLENAWPKDR